MVHITDLNDTGDDNDWVIPLDVYIIKYIIICILLLRSYDKLLCIYMRILKMIFKRAEYTKHPKTVLNNKFISEISFLISTNVHLTFTRQILLETLFFKYKLNLVKMCLYSHILTLNSEMSLSQVVNWWRKKQSIIYLFTGNLSTLKSSDQYKSAPFCLVFNKGQSCNYYELSRYNFYFQWSKMLYLRKQKRTTLW